MNSNWRFMLATFVALCANLGTGEGVPVDPFEYDKSLRKVVSASCDKFERKGIKLYSHGLRFGDQEIIDSFINGREFYRDEMGRRHDMKNQLGWLKENLGEYYLPWMKKWEAAIAARNQPNFPRLSRSEIKARLDELERLPTPPLKMWDGCCRSSSGCNAVEVECIHCGRHIVYPYMDQHESSRPPNHYRKIAQELRRWGLDVDVDGRAACPECSPIHREWKLFEVPTTVRLKPENVHQKSNTIHLGQDFVRFIRPDVDIHVRRFSAKCVGGPTFGLHCTFPEAWLTETDHGGYDIYASPGEGYIHGLPSVSDIVYAQPRETKTTAKGQTFVKILNHPSPWEFFLRTNTVDVVRRCRATPLEEIPPTYFIIHGQRVEMTEDNANLLLAFVQGYDTVISGYFHDWFAIKPLIPWLRRILLAPPTKEPVLWEKYYDLRYDKT